APTAPRREPERGGIRAVVVAEVVAVGPRADPQVDEEPAAIDDAPRAIDISGCQIDGGGKADRGVALGPQERAVVPIAGLIQTAGGRPDPAARAPYPIFAVGRPIAASPAIAGVVIVPCAGDVEVVVGRGGARWADFQAVGWGGPIFELTSRSADPKTGHSLPAAIDFGPVGRNPAHLRRRYAPQAADPDEILGLFVPFPVAVDPDCSFGAIVGPDLVNVAWGLLGDHGIWLGIVRRRGRKGFVHRSAGQCLDPLRIGAGWWRRNRGVLGKAQS